jgi:predicted dienelactone hydrolase
LAPVATPIAQKRKVTWGIYAAVAAVALLAFGFFSGRITGFHATNVEPSASEDSAAAETGNSATSATPPATPTMPKPSPAMTTAGTPAHATAAPHSAPAANASPSDAIQDTTDEIPAGSEGTASAAEDLSALPAASAELSLHDGSRGRDIPIKVYYPDHFSGSVPLIIFSPGYGGNREGYPYLGRGWAAAGYVVIVPTHAGSDNLALRTNAMRGVEDEAQAFANQVLRAGDLRFLISSVKEIEHQIPAIKGNIDRKRIGVAGHSMGGGTALLIAGATAAAPGTQPKSFRDNHVKDDHVRAVIAMSPPGPGRAAFVEHSWDQINIPVMTMSGTRDRGVGGELPEWRTQPYKHMTAGDKYQVTVSGATHLAFAVGARHHQCILQQSTAFWDGYLKGQPKAIHSTAGCDVISK